MSPLYLAETPWRSPLTAWRTAGKELARRRMGEWYSFLALFPATS